MARLPTPGSDDGIWGNVLNDYLSQAHAADGTLLNNTVTSSAIADSAVTPAKLSVTGSAPANNNILSYDSASQNFQWTTPPTGTTNLSVEATATNVTVASSTGDDAIIPEATTSSAGVLSATDKTKLNSIATGAANVVVYNTYADAPALPIDTVVISRTGV